MAASIYNVKIKEVIFSFSTHGQCFYVLFIPCFTDTHYVQLMAACIRHILRLQHTDIF